MLDKDELANVDDGYKGEDPQLAMSSSGICYMEEPRLKAIRKWLRKWHETFNKRIKQFKVLSTTFHHPLEKHSSCFHACCILTQVFFKMSCKAPFAVDDATRLANDAYEMTEEFDAVVRRFALKQIADIDAALAK